jgi:hypothetical protein
MERSHGYYGSQKQCVWNIEWNIYGTYASSMDPSMEVIDEVWKLVWIVIMASIEETEPTYGTHHGTQWL